jgi:hypothetical protein
VDVLYCSIRSIVLRTIDVLENNRIRQNRLNKRKTTRTQGYSCTEGGEDNITHTRASEGVNQTK